MLVDVSYAIFVKYFNTLSWYKANVDPAPCIPDVVSCPSFRHKFISSFFQSVLKICTNTGVNPNNVIFAKDCRKRDVWRKALYPSYKVDRVQSSQFNGEVFAFVYGVVLPEWRERFPRSATLDVDRAEGDDIIGTIHRAVREGESLAEDPDNPPRRLVVVTNDSDCLQLEDSRDTLIVNILGQDITYRSGHMTGRQFLYCKILMGDRSDSIPGAVNRCGFKTASRIVEEGIPADVAARDCFLRNKKLMDLSEIPPDIVLAIVTAANEGTSVFGGLAPPAACLPDPPPGPATPPILPEPKPGKAWGDAQGSWQRSQSCTGQPGRAGPPGGAWSP